MRERGTLAFYRRIGSQLARAICPPGASRGQVMLIFAMMLTAMMGMLALSLDLGFGLMERRAVQNFADTTAMGGVVVEGDNATLGPTHTDQDVYNIFSDSIAPASIPASKLTITNPAGVGTTRAQVYIVGVYTDVSGTPLAGPLYVTNTPTTLNASANGIQSTVTMTYGTFFAGVIGFPQVKVSATATAIEQHFIIKGSTALNPYAARWDPPYGPNPPDDGTLTHGATEYASGPLFGGAIPQKGCLNQGTAGNYQCAANGGGDPVYDGTTITPNVTGVLQYFTAVNGPLLAAGQTPMTFKLWDNGNGWLNENVGPTALDTDWQANSSSFKGIFNTKTNNCAFANSGSGEGSHPSPIINADGVGLFPLVDTSSGSGSNINLHIYNIIAIKLTQNNGSGLRGYPVSNVTVTTNDPLCGNVTFTTTGQFIFPRLIS